MVAEHHAPARTSRPSRGILGALLVLVLAVALTVAAGRAVVASSALSAADTDVLRLVRAHVPPGGRAVSSAVGMLLGAGAWPCSLAVVVGIGIARRSAPAAARAAVILFVAWQVASSIKPVVGRPRPDPAVIGEVIGPIPSSMSFPSGHTAIAATIAAAVVLSLRPGRARALVLVAGAVLVAVTGWSRLVLGVHYPGDVAASAVLVPVVAGCTARVIDGIGRWVQASDRRRRVPSRS